MSSIPETLHKISIELDSLAAQTSTVAEGTSSKDIERIKAQSEALDAARALVRQLETPWDRLGRMLWVEQPQIMAVQIAIGMGLFKKLHELNDQSPSSTALASEINADPLLVKRVLRCLASCAIVKQVGQDAYQTTPLSMELLKPESSGVFDLYRETSSTNYVRSPLYFREHGYAIPVRGDELWKFSMKTDKPYFQYLVDNPPLVERFYGIMKTEARSWANWTDFYPTENLLNPGSEDQSSPVIVDVGGGPGLDLVAFIRKHPSAARRLILQDLPETLAKVTIDEDKIQKMPHNFFEPQPVIGARVYFLHAVLHDWSDGKAVEILENLKPAFRKGYSKILLNEITLSIEKPSELFTAFDMTMMSLFGGMERDETAWTELIERAGMQLVKIWKCPGNGQDILEIDWH